VTGTLRSAQGDKPGAVNEYYVYIMTNKSRTLYAGVTNDLKRRVYQHKHKLIPGFTSKYNITQLVYFETTPDIKAAIAREKQIKGWLRSKKIALVESVNPTWQDLSAGWFAEPDKAKRDPSLRSG
jgi:putative endonuclease